MVTASSARSGMTLLACVGTGVCGLALGSGYLKLGDLQGYPVVSNLGLLKEALASYGRAREYLSRLYFDSWVADPRALRYLIDTCGVDRVMLGTDYPFPLGEQEPGAGIAALALEDAAQARLYHGTALEWLGLSASRFQ